MTATRTKGKTIMSRFIKKETGTLEMRIKMRAMTKYSEKREIMPISTTGVVTIIRTTPMRVTILVFGFRLRIGL